MKWLTGRVARHGVIVVLFPWLLVAGVPSGLSTPIKDHLAGGASRLTALLLPHILPVCSVVAPCQPGAALRVLVLVQRGQTTRAYGGQTSAIGTAKVLPPARWVTPRTPDGRPDLQGVWDFRTATPLERPPEFAEREFLNDQTVAAVEQRAAARLRVFGADDPLLNTPPWWLDYGASVVGTKRASLVVDPPDGKVPPMTPQGSKRLSDLVAARDAAEGPEGLTPWDRCITKGLPAAMLPGAQNNNLQIVQTPGYVVIVTEMIHEARIVPMDGRGSVPRTVRAWTGFSRGRWEGDTLVIETANFSDKADFRGAGGNLRLIERLTRIDDRTIEYRLTVEDPTTWTRPWTVAVPLIRNDAPIYEYACHEANYSLGNTLSIARKAESAAAGRR